MVRQILESLQRLAFIEVEIVVVKVVALARIVWFQNVGPSLPRWVPVAIFQNRGRRDGNPYQTPGDPNNPQSFVQTAYTYGYRVGEKFNGNTNVIFNIGQDAGADTYAVSPPRPRGIGQTAWQEMARGVADGYNGHAFCSPGDESCYHPTDYDTITITFHPGDTDVGLSSSHWFHPETWEDFNAMQVPVPADTYPRVKADYNLTPNSPKPTVFIEGGYEDYVDPNNGFTFTPRVIRIQAWHSMFTGAAGYTYGHQENAFPLQTSPPINPGNYIDDDGANQITHLQYFLDSHSWWRFVPDQSVIDSGEGLEELRHVAVKDSGGRECYVYYPAASSSAVIKLSSVNGNGVLNNYLVEVKWFNPKDRSESTDPSSPYVYRTNPPTNVMRSFSRPANWDDGVLMLRNIGN